MNLNEAKQILRKNGYICINERSDNRIYSIDVYYNEDGGFPDFDKQEPEETLRYTFDEMVKELGPDAASDIVTEGCYDTGNNTYYKLNYIENADTGERTSY